MNKLDIQHLYWRAGFGISPKQLELLSQKTREEIVGDLFSKAKIHQPLYVDTSEFDTLSYEQFSRTKKTEREYIAKSRIKIKELNHEWVYRMSHTNNVLNEKVTLFWINHFSCHDRNILHLQNFNNTIRYQGLGNFGDLVKAVSREATMIKYLDLRQNKKNRPNENFARELMELFTLGVGNYTEEDIKEAAKAFTGYSFDFEGNFVFNESNHDNGFKYPFGKAGRYDGDDIIDTILEQKTCAEFICTKMYRYFVSDTISPDHIEEMVAVFYPKYEIEPVLKYMFSQDWFYKKEFIGNKIKSPIDLLVGISRVVPLNFKETNQLFHTQRLLGQKLFHPPNVAGWKGGRSWIDSNTLMIRLKLPSLLLSQAYISTNENKESLKTLSKNTAKKENKSNYKVSVDWKAFNSDFKDVPIENLTNYLLQSPINKGTQEYLDRLVKSSKKDYCVQIMSLPEYQMC
ncbi:DUF1800 domain-containing protein [Xanthomarina sp. F1114]|uniref:DUF1800 domain-containing protein n=1 Tax=Xanthomarina sp. F1114 TaxID=2996019 RepID=UPI00225DF512|nr:DUF1800 domain-containing protein [Xanthomarina sp. F1114]MCX7546485.1 DUF1800 domain-containing protein [Xanthomarina sp. F1114]